MYHFHICSHASCLIHNTLDETIETEKIQNGILPTMLYFGQSMIASLQKFYTEYSWIWPKFRFLFICKPDLIQEYQNVTTSEWFGWVRYELVLPMQ